MKSPTQLFPSLCRAEPAIFALAVGGAVLGLVALAAPALINLTALLACAFLLALVLRRVAAQPWVKPRLVDVRRVDFNPFRLCVFLILESAILAGIWFLHGPAAAFLPAVVFAAFRYSVLLPVLVLLPWSAWRSFAGSYRTECVATLIALATWFPHRLFVAAWPYYSPWLGHAVHALARPFVSSLQYVPNANPILAGPNLDVTIIFACSGLQAIKLFQVLFAFVLIVDWNVLDRRRIFQGYFAGLGLALLANCVRIALLVVLGNHLSTDAVIRYHLTAGWMYFAAVFSVFLWISYDWLRGGSRTAAAVSQKDEVVAVALR